MGRPPAGRRGKEITDAGADELALRIPEHPLRLGIDEEEPPGAVEGEDDVPHTLGDVPVAPLRVLQRRRPLRRRSTMPLKARERTPNSSGEWLGNLVVEVPFRDTDGSPEQRIQRARIQPRADGAEDCRHHQPAEDQQQGPAQDEGNAAECLPSGCWM